MGTFHDNLGELHGITIAVETTDGRAIVGRCHEATDQHVLMLDVDVHQDGADDMSNDDWLRRAARWGVFPREKTLRLDRGEVTNLRRLNEINT